MSDSGRDFDRRLTVKGQRQAERVAELLAQRLAPSRHTAVLASPAARTLATAQAVAAALSTRPETDDRLRVDEPVSGMLEALALPARAAHAHSGAVVLVGHNPRVSELIDRLAATGQIDGPVSLRKSEGVLLSWAGAGAAAASLIAACRVLGVVRGNA